MGEVPTPSSNKHVPVTVSSFFHLLGDHEAAYILRTQPDSSFLSASSSLPCRAQTQVLSEGEVCRTIHRVCLYSCSRPEAPQRLGGRWLFRLGLAASMSICVWIGGQLLAQFMFMKDCEGPVPVRTSSPYFSCSLCRTRKFFELRLCHTCHSLVKPASFGPGNFLVRWKYAL